MTAATSAASISPFVEVQRLGMSDELGQQFFVFLVLFIFDPDMVGRAPHPISDRLIRIVRNLLALGETEARAAVVVKVLADEVNVIEAIGEQPAGPVRRREINGNQ